ncbi:MAG TPA: hypothetical protein DEE98_06395 [Elusimicrobia bacterium]|nr:MAG: hypothetical protein A2278_02295 [Elusimicrobia bacterium RIFOXYA12_FULL_49_49]OGS10677.1 MAG: hypothetical protein A2386_01340 [Elusimicrobia bacterium RIFOXYB1_FULL_48_9]OGS16877.1 MAG: hypothetical protein A2251_05745 [Elusimicrobia bacterium RIFOXYA2_FULL_47_53]OGS32105.1 MAG: hypothetical protein A2323_08520 [Elusimicrobia bacterium RIFOXYB2_FULL_46_23]HBU70000.1 hypothetical protein [Elusimicrobiota bacterium]
MDKNKKPGNSGPIKAVFIALLMLFGALSWVFFRYSGSDLTLQSARVDAGITDILFSLKISDSDIISQSREEKRSAGSLWIENYKKIRIRKGFDLDAFISRVGELAERYKLTLKKSKLADNSISIEASAEGKILSRIVLLPPVSSVSNKKRVVLVIDDVGYYKGLNGFSELGIPVTFAVLPKERFSVSIAKELAKKGIPFIMHLPLEPEAYPKVNPGKAAILSTMSDAEIKSIFESNLKTVPGAAGVSNHMGSRFTADYEKMKYLLSLVKKHGLFFFDSYTTTKSKAAAAAKAEGMLLIENGLFLDNSDDTASIDRQLDILLNRLKKHDTVIAIGHIQKKYLLGSLSKYIPKVRQSGAEFIYLSDLYEKK